MAILVDGWIVITYSDGETMLSVIITVKNNARTVRECINRVLKAPPIDKEVIVVYGKSNDGTEEILKDFEGRVKIIRDDVSTGSAINTGVLNSNGEIIMYVEGHSFISEDALLKVLKAFQNDEDLGYVIFYRYIPPLNVNKIQRLINTWRRNMKGSTMGQFRAFRKKTFFDVGGFWIFPKAADDLEFATRLYNTRWKKTILSAECWDLPPRGTLLEFIKKELMVGMCHAVWFNIYHDHPYMLKEYGIRKDESLKIFRILYRMLIKRAIFGPIFGLRIAWKERFLSFFPFYTMLHWLYIIGYFLGHKWLGKEEWDERIIK